MGLESNINAFLRKREGHFLPIEKWKWTHSDEYRISRDWYKEVASSAQEQTLLETLLEPELGDLVDRFILNAELVECLISPSEYVRARRLVQETSTLPYKK